jgi:extracellular matrix protein 14
LTWLRDKTIEKIFGLPSKSTKIVDQSAISRPSKPQLPAKLLAKYGGDVVLRFNLTTPQEEKSLAEAAETLFLDVWEFTNNWADIRLKEDEVAHVHIPVVLCV